MDPLEIVVLLENSNIQHRLQREASSKEAREWLQHDYQPALKKSTKSILVIFMLLVNLLIFAVCGTILFTSIVSVSESFQICPSPQSSCIIASLNLLEKLAKKAEYQGLVERFVFQYFPEKEKDLTQMTSTIQKVQTRFNGKPWLDDQDILLTTRATPRISPDFSQRKQVPFGVIEKEIGGPSPNLEFWEDYLANKKRKDNSFKLKFCSPEKSAKTRLNRYKNHSTLCELLEDLSLTPAFRDYLWDYVKIAVEGGVVSNHTTDWRHFGQWHNQLASPEVLSSIGMFVILEPKHTGNPVQQEETLSPLQHLQRSVIVAFGAVPGHPIVIDTIRSLVTTMGKTYPSWKEQTGGDLEAHFKQAFLRYISITVNASVEFSSSDGVKTNGGSMTIGDLVIYPSKELVKGSSRHENTKKTP